MSKSGVMIIMSAIYLAPHLPEWVAAVGGAILAVGAIIQQRRE